MLKSIRNSNKLKAFGGIALTTSAMLSSLAFAATKPVAATKPAAPFVPISYRGACTDSEKWFPEKVGFSDYLQKRVEFGQKGIKDEAAGAQSVLRALATVPKAKGDRTDAAVAYWMARSLFDLKLTLQAHHAFNQIVANFSKPETFAIRSAAMSCLGVLHDKYPTLLLEPQAITAVRTLLTDSSIRPHEKFPFSLGLFWSLERSRTDSEAVSLAEPLKDGGFFQKLSSIYIATRKSDEAAIIQNEDVMSDPLFSRLPKSEDDAIRLAFAMSEYDLGHYAAAEKLFTGISNTSNLFVRALTGQAWSRLWQKHYEETIGASSNLVVGGLNKTFAPEAYETLAIALLETCNHNTVLTVLGWFRRSYESSHRYLDSLMAKGDSVDPYQLVSQYLLGKIKVPERVGTDWISDPVFLANQGEINAHIDSIDSLKKLEQAVQEVLADAKYKAQRPSWSKRWQSFDASLALQKEKLQTRQTQLIQEIRSSLKERNRRMVDALNKSAENLQLVEAETYELIGDRLIAEAGPADSANAKKKKKAKDQKNEGAVWDWGTYSGSIDDHGEVWEDELGALRANLKKTCDSQ